MSQLVAITTFIVVVAHIVTDGAVPRSGSEANCTDVVSAVTPIWKELVEPGDLLTNADPQPPMILEPNRVEATTPDSLTWRAGWQGKPPPKALVQAWYQKRRSIAHCLSGPIAGVSIDIVDAKAARATLERGRGTLSGSSSGPYIADISEPVFDRSRTKALVVFSRSGNSLGGRTELYHLEKIDGVWGKAGSRVTQIS